MKVAKTFSEMYHLIVGYVREIVFLRKEENETFKPTFIGFSLF